MNEPKARRIARVKRAPRGKIAHLPAELRREVSRRLHDGEPAQIIVDWLNANPAVAEALRRNLPRFSATVDGHALTAFRHGSEHSRYVAMRESIAAAL